MTRHALECDELVVRAGGRTILDIPRLVVSQGQLIGLIGPNGAGKSTILRCLLGMQAASRGNVSVLEKNVNALSSGELGRLRRRIGFVPQLLPTSSELPLTVREVVAIGRTGIAGLLRPLRREDWRIVDAWIERLGLSALAKRGFSEISGGEQRKTLIARAMVQQPELLLLDEPTANLDLGWRERIVETIDELYESMALTVVLVCHELEVLPASCNRVIVLANGRVRNDGHPADVLTTSTVADLYGPGLSIVRSGGRFAVIPGEQPHA